MGIQRTPVLDRVSRGVLPLLALLLIPAGAFADGDMLESHAEVRQACEGARDARRPSLYVMEVEPGWRFGAHERPSNRLPVDTRRNFHALGGHVSLLLSGLETPEFEATREQAEALETAREAGARLRIGFFLGFDDPGRQPCVVRSAHGVTIVRAELAYAELVSSSDERVARSESDRLRAWTDDQEALAIPGEGPRGAVGMALFPNGEPAPERWQTALQADACRSRIATCHAAGVSRGVAPEGQVVVRLNVETRSGRIRRADVAITSIGDSNESECIARALGSSGTLPPGPSTWNAEVVDLSVPVRLAVE